MGDTQLAEALKDVRRAYAKVALGALVTRLTNAKGHDDVVALRADISRDLDELGADIVSMDDALDRLAAVVRSLEGGDSAADLPSKTA